MTGLTDEIVKAHAKKLWDAIPGVKGFDHLADDHQRDLVYASRIVLEYTIGLIEAPEDKP